MTKLRIKRSIICRNLGEDFKINRKIKTKYQPKAGDLAVFQVLEIGKHPSIQGTNGNNTYIFPGDHIMMAFGNRYATEQFEGYIPDTYQREYHILGKGGAVGVLASMHAKIELKGPTTLRLIGYVTDPQTGEVINSKRLAGELTPFDLGKQRSYQVILSLGTGMDSGKTTTAAFLSRGLMLAGKKVAYIKLTGTVFTKDRSLVRDCGADQVADFSTAGFPSTYLCDVPELRDLYETLLEAVSADEQDYVVIEIADGLLQRETSMLLHDTDFMSTVDHIVLSSVDSMGILHGIAWLEQKVARRPRFLAGLFTASPLLIKEATAHTTLPILTLAEMADAQVVQYFPGKETRPLAVLPKNGTANGRKRTLYGEKKRINGNVDAKPKRVAAVRPAL